MSSITLYPSDDSYVSERDPDANYDSSEFTIGANIEIGGTSGREKRGWFKFDLSSITNGSTINLAEIFFGSWQEGGDYSQTYELILCEDTSWAEDTITWNNAPDIALVGSPSGTWDYNDKGLVSFDVTADVSGWLSHDAMAYRISNPSPSGPLLWIYDRESAANVYIEIDYTEPSVGSPVGSFFFGS